MAGVAVPKAVQDVLDECVAALGENLKAALWHGSWARGEQRPGSDHDLILIFRRVDDGVLLALRDIFRERENWSTYVRSEDELRQHPADNRLQFAYGFHVLYGEFQPLPASRQHLLAELRSLAAEIAFQCRDRLIHEHAGWSRQVHMMHYMAKNAIRAMKARHLLRHGHYPETRAELRSIVDDPAELKIIDWVERWEELRPGFEADPAPLMLHLEDFARRLVKSLPEQTEQQPNERT